MPRDYNHDYRSKSIYHITIGKAPGVPDFSTLVGEPESLIVRRSTIGMIIENHIKHFHHIHPDIHSYQYVIMPDHVHFLLHVKKYLQHPLGSYIGTMKVKIRQYLRSEINMDLQVFEQDFYDRILRPTHSLNTIFNYIRTNPYRLAIRKKHPDFFCRIKNFSFAGHGWQLYGNMHLLFNPFKEQVVVHRADSEKAKEMNINRWLHTASNGGVLVSPFISPSEKEIRQMSENAEGKVILLTNEPFKDRCKPAAHDFRQCEIGKLLIMAPAEPLPPGRATFLYLNKVAADIAATQFYDENYRAQRSQATSTINKPTTSRRLASEHQDKN